MKECSVFTAYMLRCVNLCATYILYACDGQK